jgi:large subunit ribosomal protein L9
MKVILTQDVKAQGKKGQLVDVSDGYARNFLIPKKLAVEANAANMSELKNAETKKRIQEEKELANAKEIAAKLQGCMVKLQRASGEDGKLYGSVATKDIAEALMQQYGIEIDKRKIVLPDAIKNYGSYTVAVKLHPAVSGTINFVVAK